MDRITGLSNADRALGGGIRKDAVRCQSEELWSVTVTGVPLTFQRTPLCHIGFQICPVTITSGVLATAAKSTGALSTSSGMKLCDSGKCLFIVRMMAVSASFVRAQCDHLRWPFISVMVTVIINTSLSPQSSGSYSATYQQKPLAYPVFLPLPL